MTQGHENLADGDRVRFVGDEALDELQPGAIGRVVGLGADGYGCEPKDAKAECTEVDRRDLGRAEMVAVGEWETLVVMVIERLTVVGVLLMGLALGYVVCGSVFGPGVLAVLVGLLVGVGLAWLLHRGFEDERRPDRRTDAKA